MGSKKPNQDKMTPVAVTPGSIHWGINVDKREKRVENEHEDAH
jgi:hypothetical protein